MKAPTFLLLWSVLYGVLMFGVMVFIAWGLPNVSAWSSAERALFVFVAAFFAVIWTIVGTYIAERDV